MIEVRCVADEDEFFGLESAWNDLLRRSSANSPFLTHQWLLSWWKAFGGSSRLHVLVCCEDTGQEQSLLGIFPGYVTSNRFPFVSRLRLLGSEVVASDFLDVIVASGRETESLSALLAHLCHEEGHHLVELTDLREESPLLRATDLEFGCEWSLQEWPVQKLCPAVPLPKTSADYFAGLSRGVRKNFQYYRRRLESQGARLEIIERKEDLPGGMEDFSRLHRSRCSQKGQSGIFSSESQRSFYSEVFERFFQAGWLELAFLNVAGERVAGVCQFSYGDAVYYYQTGYNVSWEKSSVGFVLNGILIERAIHQGKSFYEFLRGEEEYKFRLGATRRRCLRDLYLKNGSFTAEMFLRLRRLNRDSRALVKALLRPVLGVRIAKRSAGA